MWRSPGTQDILNTALFRIRPMVPSPRHEGISSRQGVLRHLRVSRASPGPASPTQKHWWRRHPCPRTRSSRLRQQRLCPRYCKSLHIPLQLSSPGYSARKQNTLGEGSELRVDECGVTSGFEVCTCYPDKSTHCGLQLQPWTPFRSYLKHSILLLWDSPQTEVSILVRTLVLFCSVCAVVGQLRGISRHSEWIPFSKCCLTWFSDSHLNPARLHNICFPMILQYNVK